MASITLTPTHFENENALQFDIGLSVVCHRQERKRLGKCVLRKVLHVFIRTGRLCESVQCDEEATAKYCGPSCSVSIAIGIFVMIVLAVLIVDRICKLGGKAALPSTGQMYEVDGTMWNRWEPRYVAAPKRQLQVDTDVEGLSHTSSSYTNIPTNSEHSYAENRQ